MRTTRLSIDKTLCALLLVAGVMLSGCGKSSTTPANPVNVGAPTYSASVDITNFAFSPAAAYVLTGGTVTWKNMDPVDHTATDLNGNFDSGHIGTSQTYKFTFTKAGTYTYHCSIHSQMASATIVVSNP